MDKETVRNSQVRIVTDIALWNLLLQGVKKQPKYSRLEAFRDLMERQRIALLTGDGKFMKGSVLEFSKAWGWDREYGQPFLGEVTGAWHCHHDLGRQPKGNQVKLYHRQRFLGCTTTEAESACASAPGRATLPLGRRV
jgi:hypothetical protein